MDSKKRIAHVLTKMDVGGAETFIKNVYRNIDRSKYNFDFIVYSDEEGEFDKEIKSLGGRIFRITSPGKNIIKYLKDFYSICKKEKFDVIHSHAHHFSGINSVIAKLAGIKVIISHSHTTVSDNTGSMPVKVYRKIMTKLIKIFSTNLLACSDEAAEALFKDIKNPKVSIVNNGIEINRFIKNSYSKEECREKLGLPRDSYIIGNVGRFRSEKNHNFMIDLFKYINERNSNTSLVLVGNGELLEVMKEKVGKLGLSNNVIFLGMRQDIDIVLKAFDVFVFPSLYEGLGIAVIEAEASGLKCVVSDNVPKAVDLTGNVRFLSLNDDMNKWYDELINNKDLKDIKNSLSSYDIDVVVDELCNIYSSK